MATVTLNPKTFEEAIEKSGITLIDWWAPWCGPCRSFAPTYERVSERHADITFAKVNTEEEPMLSGSLGIQSIPTLMVFRDGILLYSEAGALPERALEEIVKQARALDMDKVRQEIAEREKAEAEAEG
jgi:thioredoxin 1